MITIQEEHDQLKWELCDELHKESPDSTVENQIHVSFRARRQLMAKYFGLGQPEALLPLFKHAEDATFDVWDITFMFAALAKHKKGELGIALWQRHLKQVEKYYWSGLREFRRRFKYQGGNPADIDPDGDRSHLYEETRRWLNRGYQHFINDLCFVPARLSKGLEAEIKERRRLVNSEQLPTPTIHADPREMTEAVFWELIKKSQADDVDDHLEALGNLLRGFQPKQIKRFNQHLKPLLKSAATWDLWGAGYLLQGGCSDDGFLYFRCWLILQGKEKFLAAIKNADAIAKWVVDNEDETYDAEELMYLADQIYEEVTGKDGPEMGIAIGGKVEGKRWKKLIELKERLPKLFRRFPCNEEAE